MNFLITAGATREYIDPVRFISNPSSGEMGISIASASKKMGHDVILIMGHCTTKNPQEIPMVMASSAAQMQKAVYKYLDWADVLVMTAAVGDWKAKRIEKKKIKKENKSLTLELTRNPDVLASVGRLKKKGKKIFLVGFSVDTESLVSNAKKKLKNKNLDLIVANPKNTFGSVGIEATIIDKKDKLTQLPMQPKKRIARKLVKIIEKALSK